MNKPTKTVNIQVFAAYAARTDKLTYTSAAPFRKAYEAYDAEHKSAMRSNWKLGYVRELFSLSGITLSDAQISKGTEGTTKKIKDEKGATCTVTMLLDRANSRFTDYIVKDHAVASETATLRIKAEEREEALRMIGVCKNIDRAISVLKAMKKTAKKAAKKA